MPFFRKWTRQILLNIGQCDHFPSSEIGGVPQCIEILLPSQGHRLQIFGHMDQQGNIQTQQAVGNSFPYRILEVWWNPRFPTFLDDEFNTVLPIPLWIFLIKFFIVPQIGRVFLLPSLSFRRRFLDCRIEPQRL